MEPVLEAVGITKVFTEGSHRVEALRGVSLAIAPGEVVALEGPSGSGKTTLLSILGCILTATAGEVRVGGRVVDSIRADQLREVRRSQIGFVFQQYNLFAALTARENVEYALVIKGAESSAAPAEAARLLERVGLAHRADFLPRDLSGGEKQRVAIARALARRPVALLADEPTANLDRATGLQVLGLFAELARESGAGVVIVTHDPQVRSVAQRVVAILDGRFVRPQTGEAA